MADRLDELMDNSAAIRWVRSWPSGAEGSDFASLSKDPRPTWLRAVRRALDSIRGRR